MAETTLLLRTSDIAKLSSISGNVDIDKLTPYIKLAQRNEVRRILGVPLYDKILEDYENDTLVDEYLYIYDEFVVDMLSYFSAGNFVQFGAYQITNGGVYRATSPEMQTVDYEELQNVSKSYYVLGNGVELMFKKYIKDNPVTEYPNDSCGKNGSTFGLNWKL